MDGASYKDWDFRGIIPQDLEAEKLSLRPEGELRLAFHLIHPPEERNSAEDKAMLWELVKGSHAYWARKACPLANRSEEMRDPEGNKRALEPSLGRPEVYDEQHLG
jgi:hypothetical protein